MKDHTNLVKLTLVEIILTDVGAELFTECANKLSYLKLTNHNTYCVTRQQITTLAVQAEQHSQLKQLILQALDLSVVPSQVLARFINRLDKFSISNCKITDEQARDMFDKMAQETELKELEIHG